MESQPVPQAGSSSMPAIVVFGTHTPEALHVGPPAAATEVPPSQPTNGRSTGVVTNLSPLGQLMTQPTNGSGLPTPDDFTPISSAVAQPLNGRGLASRPSVSSPMSRPQYRPNGEPSTGITQITSNLATVRIGSTERVGSSESKRKSSAASTNGSVSEIEPMQGLSNSQVSLDIADRGYRSLPIHTDRDAIRPNVRTASGEFSRQTVVRHQQPQYLPRDAAPPHNWNYHRVAGMEGQYPHYCSMPPNGGYALPNGGYAPGGPQQQISSHMPQPPVLYPQYQPRPQTYFMYPGPGVVHPQGYMVPTPGYMMPPPMGPAQPPMYAQGASYVMEPYGTGMMWLPQGLPLGGPGANMQARPSLQDMRSSSSFPPTNNGTSKHARSPAKSLPANVSRQVVQGVAAKDVTTVYVGNLDISVSEESLKEVFAAFGEVIDAEVIRDTGTLVSRGFAFIDFATPEQAAAAIGNVDSYSKHIASTQNGGFVKVGPSTRQMGTLGVAHADAEEAASSTMSN